MLDKRLALGVFLMQETFPSEQGEGVTKVKDIYARCVYIIYI